MEYVDDWEEVGISFGSEGEEGIYLGGIHCDRSSKMKWFERSNIPCSNNRSRPNKWWPKFLGENKSLSNDDPHGYVPWLPPPKTHAMENKQYTLHNPGHIIALGLQSEYETSASR